MKLRRVARMRKILDQKLSPEETAPPTRSGLSRTQKVIATSAVVTAGAALAALGVQGHENLQVFETALNTPGSIECQIPTLPASNVITGKTADGRTWTVRLGAASNELRADGKLSPASEAALCTIQRDAHADGMEQKAALAKDDLSSTQRSAAAVRLKADAIGQAATHRLLSADDFTTFAVPLISHAFDDAAQRGSKQHGAELQATWATLGAQQAQTARLAASRSSAYTESDEAVLQTGMSSSDAERVPGAEAAGEGSAILKVVPLSVAEAAQQKTGLSATNEEMKGALSAIEDRLVQEAASDYLDFKMPVPAQVRDTVLEALRTGKPFEQIHTQVTQEHLKDPAVLAAHVARAMQHVNALVERMLPGTKPDAAMTAMVEQKVKKLETLAQINNAIVEQLVDTPAFHIAQLDTGDDVWPENAAATDCSVDAIVNLLGTEGVSGRTRELYNDARAIEQFDTRDGIPGGPFLGERTIALAKQRGFTLEGYFNASRELGPMEEALRNGYSIIINGNVQGSTAGHFLVAQKMNPDGTFKMNDSVLTEFAARSITPEQLHAFTHNGRNPPGFYALRLSHQDMMKNFGEKFLMKEPPPVA